MVSFLKNNELANIKKIEDMNKHEILVEFAKERFENPHSKWLFDDNSVTNIAKSTTRFDKSNFLNLDKA